MGLQIPHCIRQMVAGTNFGYARLPNYISYFLVRHDFFCRENPFIFQVFLD